MEGGGATGDWRRGKQGGVGVQGAKYRSEKKKLGSKIIKEGFILTNASSSDVHAHIISITNTFVV